MRQLNISSISCCYSLVVLTVVVGGVSIADLNVRIILGLEPFSLVPASNV